MDGDETLDSLRGLYQDLSALSRSSLPHAERLLVNLESTLQDFKKLLDKPSKNNEGRQRVLSGKIKLDDVEFEINADFQQETLEVADALDIDEIEAARYYMRAQFDSKRLDRSPIVSSIIRFHEKREFLLECLRLILQESFEIEREDVQSLMKEYVASVLGIQDGALRNGSLFSRKCMDAMANIEKWLALLGEQVQKASIVGQAQESDILEVIEFQQQSLGKQHESLGAILWYLFKGAYTSSEDFQNLLERAKKVDKFDMLLVHYILIIVAGISQHGSSEGQGTLQDARSLHQLVVGSKDSQGWVIPQFHAASTVLWLSKYSGWYFDTGTSSNLQGVSSADEVQKLSKSLLAALNDGGLNFILAICAGVDRNKQDHTSRSELVTLLLKDGVQLNIELDGPSPYFLNLLMESFESFTESLIANMPDTIRTLKAEEDVQRLDQLTALRHSVSPGLHRTPTEVYMHLECLLVTMAFAFDCRNDAAEEFWADPDGNLYGFLQWISKRQTVPRASAFSEMLCSISGGKENSASAHKFLLDEEIVPSSKLRRSSSMSWAQMFAEIQLYATKITERPSATQSSTLRVRKPEILDIEEPESPIMLTCYLRLIGHLCKENADIRNWILQHPTANLTATLFTLCGAPIPQHLRAAIFTTLGYLLAERTSHTSNELWTQLDHCISGSGSLPLTLSRLTPLSGPAVWNERHAFQRITESFDQMSAFVKLLHTLVIPISNLTDSQLSLPFPESLGSSYRMPGIEPYVDFVLGQAFGSKAMVLEGKDALNLQLNCLDFAATCLESFNEHLIGIANQPLGLTDSNWKLTLSTYVRLHPFSRVMEWLFNEDVLRALFACSHQNTEDVAKESSDSVLVSCLVRSIDVMNMILDHQPTYFDIVRPMIKSSIQETSYSIASSTLACFEDCVADNLTLISDLCLYCGTGHPQLTLTSLSLLEKLSSSRKLNKPSAISSRWQTGNQLVETLNSNVEADRVARSLASQMSVDIREIESGPESSGYLIKVGLLQLLDKCLKMTPGQPTIAHLLLGFSCLGNALDIAAGSLFENGLSLFHSIVDLVKEYPNGPDGVIVSWMVHLKRLGLQVLSNLWNSAVSAALVLPYLRSERLLSVLLVSQTAVRPDTQWDDFQSFQSGFWLSSSPNAVSELLIFRTLLLEYAAIELRAASKQSSPSLQRTILGTVFGNSEVEGGQSVEHLSLFDLFDFAEIDIEFAYQWPELLYFKDINFDAYNNIQEEGSLVLYELEALPEVLQLVKEELLSRRHINQGHEDSLAIEKDKLLLFLRATNEFRLMRFNNSVTLKAWAELVSTISVTCDMEPTRLITFIRQVLQLILPKFESSLQTTPTESIQLARLGETLIDRLGKTSETRNEEAIDERLDYLFRVCVTGIPQISDNVALRESIYQICSKHLSRVTNSQVKVNRLRDHAHSAVKTAGPSLIEIICDDAYSGSEACRVSALVLLNLLVVLDQQQHSSLLVKSIIRSNYLGLFLDALRVMPSEFRNVKGLETTQLLLYYESQLSLLQQISQTKSGASHLLDAGLFQAVKDSQLFSADPDIGIDIDNPDALRRYYELLLAVLRVIVSTIFARGFHNQAIRDQTRTFLSENRQSMVGIFKRCAKIGSVENSDMKTCLEDLAKSYTALIASVDFLEMLRSEVFSLPTNVTNSMPTHHSGGKHTPMGKRKHKDHNPEGPLEDIAQKQKTIPDLFFNSQNISAARNSPLSSSTKRTRRTEPSSWTDPILSQPNLSIDEMYNFPGSEDRGRFNRLDNRRTPVARIRTANHSSITSNFTPHSGARKLVVKNLRAAPRLDQARYFDRVWSQLDVTLTSIFNQQPLPFSIEELYRAVENVCRQGKAAELANKLQERCKGHIAGNLLEHVRAKSSSGDEAAVLSAVETAWITLNNFLVTIRSIFYYLDQSFLLHSDLHPIIYEMGLLQFRSSLFSDKNLKAQIFDGALRLIELERKKDRYDEPAILKQSIKLFHDLKVYTSEFEPRLLEKSAAYFKAWADIEAKNELATYVERCHHLIEQEMARCNILLLNRSTKQKLADLLDQNLVVFHKHTLLLETSVWALLRANNVAVLEQLYTLLERKKLGSELKSVYCKYIIAEGFSIVYDQEREGDMVIRLLQFKQDLDHIWRTSFDKNESFSQGLREAFETFMNQKKKDTSTWGTSNLKPGELIAKHVDRLLRGGVKSTRALDIQSKARDSSLADEDLEINRQLDQVIDLFRFVHGKAVFAAFYKNDLAKRLLLGKSANDDAEKSMLSRLSTECGSNFTHNLETMFKDINLARDEMASYTALLREKRVKPAIDLLVQVISASAWPSYPDVPVNIPRSISYALHDFEQFYQNKYNGRKLQWKHSLANCQLTANFPDGTKELVVSSFQAVVLLLFNDTQESALDYSTIQDATGLPDIELERTLQSLACGKCKVLIKTPKGKNINHNDLFSFNSKFTHPKVKVKINKIQLKETAQENQTTHERVAADRHLETQAAIVRIMKSRKVITSPELVMEVIKATKNRGQLDAADIKTNIDKLIDKEFIERDGDNQYKYVA
ncbi:hypothetical protein FQN57_004257 [Myotisia sp. PD_48]|nr:hypothetical protein FQN57_004257 [Myotisia sp. PD_48]